ncbi:MAG: hypothetical protein RMJ66_02620, partial [Bacteroidia bacterium]|nr:hypothetical protein [Bacteroidia bacterium]MDW8133939.1 hypothetical protein [Bacteroidia bacterium]
YSSLSYYGVSYLAAWTWSSHRKWINKWGWMGITTAGILVGLLTFSMGWLMKNQGCWIHYIKDSFVRAALEDSPVKWTGWEGWPGLMLLIGSTLFSWAAREHLRLLMIGLLWMVWALLVLKIFAWRAEAHTQKPLREFCQEGALSGTLVWPVGFKSYIPFFYGQMRMETSPRVMGDFYLFEQWLLSGKAPFKVAFISRVDRYEPFIRTYSLEIAKKKGGYVLLTFPTAPHP